MSWVVGIGYNEGVVDPTGSNTKKEIEELSTGKVRDVKTLQTFVLDGELSKEDVERICRELLVDGITQSYRFTGHKSDGSHLEKLVEERGVWVAEVTFKPGVMDPVGLSVEEAIRVMGINGVKTVGTGTTFVVDGDLSGDEMDNISKKILANALIQNFRFRRLE